MVDATTKAVRMGKDDSFLQRVTAIGRRHGVPPEDVTEVAGGVANRGSVLGEALFLRVARPGFEDDLRKEAGVVPDLVERGYLDIGTAKWLSGWFTRLADRFDRDEPKVLIHGDVAAHNLLAGPDGGLPALIDWGDAAWGPRGMDFAKLPLEHVAAILPHYVRHTPPPATREDELAAATLWFHLDWGLGKLPAAPWPGQRHWTAPPASRLLGVLRFFTTTPPTPWSTLT